MEILEIELEQNIENEEIFQENTKSDTRWGFGCGGNCNGWLGCNCGSTC